MSALGHTVIGLDGAAAFAAMARADTGCEILHQDFLKLDLPGNYFDGIFANASLFHVPSQELPRVLRQLYGALKPAGVLFSSNPRGENDEGWSGERYGVYHDLAAWRRYLSHAGFTELEHDDGVRSASRTATLARHGLAQILELNVPRDSLTLRPQGLGMRSAARRSRKTRISASTRAR